LPEETNQKFSLKELIVSILNELKEILKQYIKAGEAALKERLQKLLLVSIAGLVLLGLIIVLAGAAALFLIIGSLRYLELFLPAWEAWDIMGVIAAAVAAVLGLLLYFIVKKRLGSGKK